MFGDELEVELNDGISIGELDDEGTELGEFC